MGNKSKRLHYGPGEMQQATVQEAATTLTVDDMGRTAMTRIKWWKAKKRRLGKLQRAARKRSR